jgi:hypothetical protein
MKQADYAKAVAWLQTNPAFDELCARYPQDWAAVQDEIAAIVRRGFPEELQRYLERLASKTNQPVQPDDALTQFVRSRMAHEAVKKLSLSALAADTGVTSGKLRFNWFNGLIAQRLLFARELERKPVSLRWFRLFWPLVWQKKRLMPLVQPRGIYCFYTRELVAELAEMIGGRNCLEIGAGDGTLTRFLKQQGVQVTATDNHGWNNSVSYPDWVVKQDACTALKQYKPEVAICSWPPAQNDFEHCVFETASVQLYIVIGSRHRFAFGNWECYRMQRDFELVENPRLAQLLLPPELESAVLVFRRKEGNLEHA